MIYSLHRTFEKWDATVKFCGNKWNRKLDSGYKTRVISYPYHVDLNTSMMHEHLRWCASNCNGRFHRHRKYKETTSILSIMAFEDEEDAVAFKLRWM